MIRLMCECVPHQTSLSVLNQSPAHTRMDGAGYPRPLRILPCSRFSKEDWRTYYRKLFRRMRLTKTSDRRLVRL